MFQRNAYHNHALRNFWWRDCIGLFDIEVFSFEKNITIGYRITNEYEALNNFQSLFSSIVVSKSSSSRILLDRILKDEARSRGKFYRVFYKTRLILVLSKHDPDDAERIDIEKGTSLSC